MINGASASIGRQRVRKDVDGREISGGSLLAKIVDPAADLCRKRKKEKLITLSPV